VELIDLIRTLRRYLVAALVAFTAVVAVATFALLSQPDRYEADATVLVTPVADLGQTSVFAVENAVPALEARLNSRSFYTQALERVPAEFRTSDVSVSGGAEPGTGVFTITAEGSDRAAVAPWANAFTLELIASNTNATVELEALDGAVEPSGAKANLGVASFAGIVALALVVAVFTALALNAFNRRDLAAEIRRRYRVEILGEIPALRRWNGGSLRPAELFGKDTSMGDRVMEGFQALRADVELLIHARGLETMAVTSDAPGEGKSTVSANLAWALASVGHKVTLVDCDLRSPSLDAMFGLPRIAGGVSDALGTKEGRIGELACDTLLPGLAVVPAGVPARHPAEILGPSLAKILPEFRGPDRLVIVDAPPLEGIAESRTIAAATGAVILVVDARRRRDLSEIERAFHMVHSTGADLLGVVINRSRVRRARENMRYYHIPSATKTRPQ